MISLPRRSVDGDDHGYGGRGDLGQHITIVAADRLDKGGNGARTA
jgi:hypothetical protein